MIAYGENIKVFTGNSNREFALTVCKELGITVGDGVVRTFSDGEVSVTLEETVRNSDVIMVLDHGEIIERGNHEELIARKGKYYQLYTGAFELE